jgi:hypothetical protein
LPQLNPIPVQHKSQIAIAKVLANFSNISVYNYSYTKARGKS